MSKQNKNQFARREMRKKHPSRAILWGLLLVFVAATVGLFIAYVVTKIDSTTDGSTEAGQLLSSMDKSVDPCTDFYQYACGNWMKTHFIPDNHAEIGAGAEKMREDVRQQIKRALEQSNTSDSKVARSAKTFYRSCIDEKQRKDVGAQPLINLIHRLGTWPLMSPSRLPFALDLEDTLVKLANHAIFPLFSITTSKDVYNSSTYILMVGTAADRSVDEYLRNNFNSSVVRAYEEFLHQLAVRVLSVSDTPALAEHINDVVLFEAELAAIVPSKEESMNMLQYQKKLNLSEMDDSNPKFNWTRFLTAFLGPKHFTITASTVLMRVTKPTYFNDVMDLYERTDKRTVANFLLMSIVTAYLPYLPPVDKKHVGVAKSTPLWKECVQTVMKYMGEAVGQLYVASYFSPIAKKKALEVTRDLQNAMMQMIEEAAWLDDVSKQKAIEKLKAMAVQVGYPDYQFNNTFLEELYSDRRVVSGNYLQTMINIGEGIVNSIGVTLNTTVKEVIVWTRSAAVVSAGYSPSSNAVRFHAAVLQPPYFGEDFPEYMLFGSIGFLAGHEITHGFDTRGSLRDKDGNLRAWWTTESRAKFNQLAECFVDQYNKVVVAGINVSGLQTLAENIADNGGLKAAYTALDRWQRQNGREPQMPGLGLTNEQVFFLSMAQPWCLKSTDAKLRLIVAKSEHSPNSVRIRMSLANSPHFAEAFKCPAGSPMNPVKKCKLW